MDDGRFIEADYYRLAKHGQHLPGDIWLVRRVPEDDRVVCVLSDGLGSGVKANVLATLTATMAVRYSADNRDPRHCAEIISRTLPVCPVRGISYSTFTIADIDSHGRLRIVEYGNPPFLLVRRGLVSIPFTSLVHDDGPGRELRLTEIDLEIGDRVVCVSDGVTQAGMGGPRTPLGWGDLALQRWVEQELAGDAELSARDLAHRLVEHALGIDGGQARDDITCGVIHLRHARRLLIVTGAPYDQEQDQVMAQQAAEFAGTKAVCGGTTADIIARELAVGIELEPHGDPEIPPTSRMNGFDLVTEGMITLSRTLALLEAETPLDGLARNGAVRLTELLLAHDIISFRVGTRINQAHQDPTLPIELGIRRNLVRNLATVLRERYAKQVEVTFI